MSLANSSVFSYLLPMPYQAPTPHDGFFKEIFSREEVVREFIEHYLPAEINSHFDLSTLSVDMEGYIAEEFKEYFSDIVASVQLQQGEGAEVYLLFEHKSGPDSMARLQVLNYMVQKWMQMYRSGELRGEPLPIIIPVVIYHGKRRWKPSLEFADLFQLPSEDFRVYVPEFSHLLHDISHIDEEAFKSTTLLEIIQLLFKYIYYPELRHKLPEVAGLLHQLKDKERITEYLEVIVDYVLSAGQVDVEDVRRVVKSLPQGEEIVNTAAEKLRKEGYERAEQEFMRAKDKWVSEGEIKSAQEMLLDYIQDELDVPSRELLGKIRAIESYDILMALFRKARKLNSLEDFSIEVDKALK